MQRHWPAVLLVAVFSLLARPIGANASVAQEIPNPQPNSDGIEISGKNTAEIEAQLNDAALLGYQLERIDSPSTKRGRAKLAQVTFLMTKSDVPSPYEYALVSGDVSSHFSVADRMWKLSYLRANGFVLFGTNRFAIRWELGLHVGRRGTILVFEKRPGASRRRDFDTEDARDAGQRELRVICEPTGKAFAEQIHRAAAEGFRAGRRKPAPHHCPKENWISTQQPSVLMARDPESPIEIHSYRVLTSHRASSLLKQIQRAAIEGYRVVPQALYTGKRKLFRTSPLIVLLEKIPDNDSRFEYLMVTTTKPSKRRQRICDAKQRGYQQVGYASLRNGAKNVFLFERPRNPE